MSSKQEVEITIKIETDQNNRITSAKSIAPKKNGKKKIKTSLSVSQLAYYINLLESVGMIRVSNVSEVIRVFAENVRTDHSNDISFESLRSKYYSLEPQACKAVKDIVIKQLNQIQRDLKEIS